MGIPRLHFSCLYTRSIELVYKHAKNMNPLRSLAKHYSCVISEPCYSPDHLCCLNLSFLVCPVISCVLTTAWLLAVILFLYLWILY